MSRIGNKLITLPEGLSVTIGEGFVEIKGKVGEDKIAFDPSLLKVEQEGNTLKVVRANDEKKTKALHGTTRALLHNMVVGVSEGFKKELQITGIGYRAAVSGNTLTLNVGFSHPVNFEVENGLTVECPKPDQIVVSGIDKQRVGEFAANIRATRKPEPYKGKGIAYKGEHILRKEGKKAA